MRRIGIVTVSRSDYGIYMPILREIVKDSEFDLCLMASGSHLLDEFGKTVDLIQADGFAVSERVPALSADDSPRGIAESMGRGVIGFADAYSHRKIDILVVLGDRFEMHAAALAALPFKIPVAHIHGGEETLGAFDNSLRHSISKLSHLHFTSTEEHARRLIQMGEEPWRVVVSGAPSLDNLRSTRLLTPAELQMQFSIDVRTAPLLVTFHPVTLEYEQAESQLVELLAALNMVSWPVLFTMPNADTNGRLIRRMIGDEVSIHPSWQAVENLGTQAYFSVMAVAKAMVGNSSSGIIEAASFKLPVVNIGTRQQGRTCPENVISVGYSRAEIASAIGQATAAEFRQKIDKVKNPYGDGHAAERIVSSLKSVPLGTKLIHKPFFILTPE
jgi:UDP-hydrolysing UDP-N-acetyl-D-glucosamine 2-epimerase